jgi:hypothetical protein
MQQPILMTTDLLVSNLGPSDQKQLAAYVLLFHYWLKCFVERLFMCSFFLGEVCNALIIIDHAEERLMTAEE